MTNRIVFIDSNVAEYQSLIPQLPVDSEVFVINAEQDGVMQMLAVLQNKTGIETIDIISHGKSGKLILGSDELNNSNLANYSEQLNEIGSYLNYSGDILLYGCEVAQGKIGQAFIEQMAELTGVNVAASFNLTGNADMGADWALEARVGMIHSSTLQLAYHGVLANFIGTSGNDVLNGSADDDTFTGGLGNDTLIGGAGRDVAIFSGNQIDYEFSLNSTGQVLVHDVNPANGDEGTDTLSDIETFRFVDGEIHNLHEEFQVNTYNINTDTDISALHLGGFVVSWSSWGQDGDGFGVFAQRYSNNGVALGDEIQINTYTSSYQYNSSITSLSNGDFVVTWASLGQDGWGGSSGIYGQRYSSSGVALGNEFKINTYLPKDQSNPSITALTNGDFVVVWQSEGQDGSLQGIYAQRYNVDGLIQGGEFRVNTYTSLDQYGHSITSLTDGGFIITWSSVGQDNPIGENRGIYAQRYDANGIVTGGEFRINTYIPNTQESPSIAGLSDGGFVVSWQSYGQDGSGYGIYAQRYNSSSVLLGNEFQVNTFKTDNQTHPSITALNNGGFVVSWSSSSQNDSINDIYAQRYDANGLALGNEIKVNTYPSIYSLESSITALTDGGFAVTWISVTPDGNNSYVYVQNYDANGVNNLTLTGSPNDDQLNITASMSLPTTLMGLAGNDVLKGGSNDDILEGGAGNDSIIGWSGADSMFGGTGNDSYFVENMGDIVIENLNEGTDNINSKLTYTLPNNVENLVLTGTSTINGFGNTQNNIITGNNASNQLNGEAGNDTLNGGAGNDTLIGWTGADAMIGGLGNDIYFVENVGDAITENLNQGTDTISSKLTYTLPANVENLILTGTAKVNGIGNVLSNIITGNASINQLSGNAGNDTLDGKAGNNILSGGTGNDIFKFTTKGHVDSITDYNVANDTIQLENAVFTALTTTGNLSASQFRIGTKALDANDFIIYNKTTGTLLYDGDGNGNLAGVQIATIGSGLFLTNADIVVI